MSCVSQRGSSCLVGYLPVANCIACNGRVMSMRSMSWLNLYMCMRKNESQQTIGKQIYLFVMVPVSVVWKKLKGALLVKH